MNNISKQSAEENICTYGGQVMREAGESYIMWNFIILY
jgi:hypothetical protein